jgi:hypothetical protein
MKLFYLTLLLTTLPSISHTNAGIALHELQPIIAVDEDLAPPIYEPGMPLRHHIPIYDIHTREIVTTASSVCAYELYLRLNDLPAIIFRKTHH